LLHDVGIDQVALRFDDLGEGKTLGFSLFRH
jgi:hypothetical protein